MNTIFYQGYTIEAVPRQLAESKKWTHYINIYRDKGSKPKSRNFFSKSTFDTKEEAVQHCFIFGEQIIDGKISNCTVNGL